MSWLRAWAILSVWICSHLFLLLSFLVLMAFASFSECALTHAFFPLLQRLRLIILSASTCTKIKLLKLNSAVQRVVQEMVPCRSLRGTIETFLSSGTRLEVNWCDETAPQRGAVGEKMNFGVFLALSVAMLHAGIPATILSQYM